LSKIDFSPQRHRVRRDKDFFVCREIPTNKKESDCNFKPKGVGSSGESSSPDSPETILSTLCALCASVVNLNFVVIIGTGMGKKKYFLSFLILLTLTLTLSLSWSGERKPVKPAPRDKCPVCGMFVAKYPDWVTEIIFKDGTYAIFDGPKDLFKYYLNLEKYNPSKKLSDIDSIYVTDYYSLVFIDGYKAIYVTGSDVYGPMGKELIPFEKEADAKEFMKDHKGKSLLKFKEVTMELIKQLD